uniref:SEC14 domain and spectrin repeat-containing protein 1 n=1 Tax=Myxine glutinosa TaxID=7769 RepID=UPI00358EF4EE
MGTPQKFVSIMEEALLLEILKKKLAFFSGGKDRRSGLILTIPLSSDHSNVDEISVTLNYLLSIPSEKCKSRGFTVIVDGRKASWNLVKTVVLMLQNVIPAEVSLVCVVKPDDFWDKKFTHFCFWKEKNRLGFEVILVSANKLSRYIEPCQLTDEFGGHLKHNHMDWVTKRMSFEKFDRDSRMLSAEMSCIINAAKNTSQPNTALTEKGLTADPETIMENGRQLTQELQVGGEGGPREDVIGLSIEGESTASGRVSDILEALHTKHMECRELCRQQSRMLRLEDLRQKITEVVNWFEGPGTDMLKDQKGIGNSIRATHAMQQKHEEIENLYTEWFAVYVDLGQQIGSSLTSPEEDCTGELRTLQERLNEVCYRHATRLEYRQRLLHSATAFHGLVQELSQQLDGLLGLLCSDVLMADGGVAQQNLRLLEEKLQAVDGVWQGLQEQGRTLLELLAQPPAHEAWHSGDDGGQDDEPETAVHVQEILDDMALRKKRCEDMVDVRKLKLLQIIQVLKCEDDAAQAVEWLTELHEALVGRHVALGVGLAEAESLQDKHTKCHDVAQSTYEYGRELLQASVLMRKSLRYSGKVSGDALPRLTRAWKQFSTASDERSQRLQMARLFHTAADKVLEVQEGGGEGAARDCSDDDRPERDGLAEAEALGNTLLERLNMPVVYPDGTERFFGSLDELAGSADNVREKLQQLAELRTSHDRQTAIS